MEISDKWKKRHMLDALEKGKYSKDPSTKVGCVAVDSYNSPVCVGYNGLPRFVEDKPERYVRPIKYKWCLHAEMNMVANAARIGVSLDGRTAFVTTFPCSICMGLLISSGIKHICVPGSVKSSLEDETFAARWKEDLEISTQMAEEAGISIEYVELDNEDQ